MDLPRLNSHQKFNTDHPILFSAISVVSREITGRAESSFLPARRCDRADSHSTTAASSKVSVRGTHLEAGREITEDGAWATSEAPTRCVASSGHLGTADGRGGSFANG